MDRTVLTAKEVQARLRCGLTHVYELYKRGQLDGFKDGRSVRFYEDSIAAYLERSRNPRAKTVLEPPPAPAPRRQSKLREPVTGFRHLRF